MTDGYTLLILNPEGRIVTGRVEESLGYTEDELEGQSFEIFYTEEGKKSGAPSKDLEEAKEQPFHKEKKMVLGDGTKFRARTSINPIKDHNGKLLGFVNVVRHTDSDHAAEVEKELNRFNSLVTHELRDVLNVAEGYLGLARESRKYDDFEKVKKAHKDMLGIIEDLLTISRGENLPKEELSIEEVFKHAFKYSRAEDTTYNVQDIKLQAGRTSLIRLFSNLIINSIEHNKKPVHLEIGPLENSEGLYYEDNGKGILENEQEKVFERDYTSSESNGGLGLFIVDRIAKFNGWEIKLEESSLGGARFEIYTHPN